MRMARVNVYLPDDLAEEARAAGLNVSSVVQAALRRELAKRRTTAWVARISSRRPSGVSHDTALAALHAVRDEMGTRNAE